MLFCARLHGWELVRAQGHFAEPFSEEGFFYGCRTVTQQEKVCNPISGCRCTDTMG